MFSWYTNKTDNNRAFYLLVIKEKGDLICYQPFIHLIRVP